MALFALVTIGLLAASLLARAEPGEIVNISSATELIAFSKSVNSGTDYYGMTVLLTEDIDFAGGLSADFSPISITPHMFIGTFDGQGHTIRNLAITSSRSFVGLFGIIAQGATVKNVVMDSTCSVRNTCDDEYIGTVGSIAGACATYSIACKLLNNVNMASVTFAGTTTDSMYMGGIVGYAKPVTALVTLRNCANYGAIEQAGANAVTATMGGVIGECYQTDVNPLRCNIKNNVNFGTITHSGKTSMYLYFGGIVGGCDNQNYLYNLVSAGPISSNKGSNFVGSLIGLVLGPSNISNCYYDNSIQFKPYGLNWGKAGIKEVHSFDTDSLVLSDSNSSTARPLTDALNEWVKTSGPSKYSFWALNRGQNKVKFVVNGKPFLTLSSKFFVVPNIDAEGFDGWFVDPSCMVAFNPSEEITKNIVLYAKFKAF